MNSERFSFSSSVILCFSESVHDMDSNLSDFHALNVIFSFFLSECCFSSPDMIEMAMLTVFSDIV